MRWPGALILIGLGAAAACGGELVPPSAPAAPVHRPPSPAASSRPARAPSALGAQPGRIADVPTGSAEPTDLSYRLVWLTPSPDWAKALALGPSGDVVVYGGRSLRVHAGASGRLLAETSGCAPLPNGVGFVDDRHGAVVCEAELELLALPSAERRVVRALGEPAAVVSFGTHLVAIADMQGTVRLLDTHDWSERRSLVPAGRVATMAVSRDDRWLALGQFDGRIWVLPVAAGDPLEIVARPGHAVTTLAFSPNGARLFGSAGPLVAVYSRSDGRVEQLFRMVREVTAARWLSERAVLVTGADGLLVLDAPDGSARSIGDGSDAESPPPVALDASADGRVLCIGTPAGSIRCMARGASPVVAPAAP